MFINFIAIILLLGTAFVLTSSSTTPAQKSISQECMKKSEPKRYKCVDQAQKHWKITENQYDVLDLNVAPKAFCCANWQAIDCVRGVFKSVCSDEDYKIAMANHPKLTRCKNYSFDTHAHTCASITPDVIPIPTPSNLTKSCLDNLEKTNVLTHCAYQNMDLYQVQIGGPEDIKWEDEYNCCFQFSQIDCRISAIQNGTCTGNSTQAALGYENQMIDYWNNYCMAFHELYPNRTEHCKCNKI